MAPVVIGEVLPCIVLSAWLAARRLLSSLRSTQQGNRVMRGISTDSCDPALPSTQHYRDGRVPKRRRLYYRMYSDGVPTGSSRSPAPSGPIPPASLGNQVLAPPLAQRECCFPKTLSCPEGTHPRMTESSCFWSGQACRGADTGVQGPERFCPEC